MSSMYSPIALSYFANRFRTGSTGPTWPLWQQPINAPSYIDLVGIVADKDGGKSIRLSVINRHPADDWKADFRFVDFGECCHL